MDENLERLLSQVSVWYDHIEKFEAATVANVATWSASSLRIRNGILESHWQKSQSIYEALLLDYAEDTEAMAMLYDAQEKAIQCYGNASKRIRARMAEIEKQESTKHHLKASEISVVRFDGTRAEWPAWRAQYFAKVFDTKLEPHEKLEILSKSLKGAAAECVGAIINRDQQELDRAWTTLTDRYDNEYQLAMAHLNEILNIKPPASDSAKGLRKIVDTINQQLRLLERFKFRTEHWGPLIIAIILRKVDHDTYKEWEKIESRRTMPELESLMKFLECRIGVLTNWRASHPIRTDAKSDNRYHPYNKPNDKNDRERRDGRHSFARRENQETRSRDKSAPRPTPAAQMPAKDPCLACAGLHRLWHCRRFKSEPIEERLSQIQAWKICPNCLVENHPSADCKKFGCPECDFAKHNSLICPKRAVKRVHHARGGKRKNANSSNNQPNK